MWQNLEWGYHTIENIDRFGMNYSKYFCVIWTVEEEEKKICMKQAIVFCASKYLCAQFFSPCIFTFAWLILFSSIVASNGFKFTYGWLRVLNMPSIAMNVCLKDFIEVFLVYKDSKNVCHVKMELQNDDDDDISVR